jgi:hypothetical protein
MNRTKEILAPGKISITRGDSGSVGEIVRTSREGWGGLSKYDI